MKGLLKNNFYASFASMRAFIFVVVILGTVSVITGNSTISTMFCCYMTVGFSASAISSLHNESITKWSKYKITTPVRRSDIVRSYYISHFFWLLVGLVFTACVAGLSVVVHGTPFVDRDIDLLMLAVVGIGAGLLMGAFFFPLLYLMGEDKQGVVTMISFACSFSVIFSVVAVVNKIFGDNMTTPQLVLGSAIILAAALALFIASYFVSVRIYKKKEF